MILSHVPVSSLRSLFCDVCFAFINLTVFFVFTPEMEPREISWMSSMTRRALHSRPFLSRDYRITRSSLPYQALTLHTVSFGLNRFSPRLVISLLSIKKFFVEADQGRFVASENYASAVSSRWFHQENQIRSSFPREIPQYQSRDGT